MSDKKTPEELKKKKARSVINNALRDGRIKKPKHCAICGKATSQLDAHHTGRYPTSSTEVKAQKIRWICRSCHQKLTGNGKRKI